MQWDEFRGRALSVMLTQDNDPARLSVERAISWKSEKNWIIC